MAISVNNNIAALNTYRNLTSTQSSLGKSLEKLSSGYRINRAADDAAGLAISEGLRSQVSGLQQASRNAQDGSNLVATADGALSTVTTILQRMRTLAVQSANDTNSVDARGAINSEVSQLNSELTRIANTTKFGDTSLLNSSSTLQFQVGANSNELIGVNLTGANVSNVATALSNQAGFRSNVAVANFTANDVLTFTYDADGSGSGAADTAAAVTLSSVPTSAGDLVSKLNANAAFAGQFSARLNSDGQLEVLGKKGGATSTVTVAHTVAAGTAATNAGITSSTAIASAINLNTQAGATAAIDTINAQIAVVSTARANLGAVQNRLDYTISNLGVATENLTASESSIRDVDMAQEMTKFTSKQILAQAGTAMLAQAKNLPQSVLSLLQG